MANIKIYSLKKDGNKSLSTNFKVNEFACHDGTDKIKIDLENVEKIQQIRDHFKQPIKITSAYRTAKYNSAIGGAKSSYHIKGMATDIVVSDVDARKVALYAESIGCRGVIWYPQKKFTHVDNRLGLYHAICVDGYYYPEPAMSLSKGTKNSYVKWLQYMLKELGYKVSVDGSFGANTESAVKSFQKKNNLTVDGVFGKHTRDILKKALM